MISTFLSNVRKRMKSRWLVHAIPWAIIAAASLLLLIALGYIIAGYAVPHAYYLFIAAITLSGILIAWFFRRIDQKKTALFADSFFDLKDSLTATLELEEIQNNQEAEKMDEAIRLQRNQTESHVRDLQAESIPIPWSRKLVATSIILTAVVTGLAFVPASPRVLAAAEEERITKERSTIIKEELEKDVEELIKSMSEEEKELITPNELRKWVKQLKETKDKREALRTYARMEQRIKTQMSKMDQRKDEALLKDAGIKLEKAKEAKAREIGEDLKKKDYKAASEKLKEFKGDKKKKFKEAREKSKLADKKRTPEELKKKRAELAKMRSLTKRLAEAARQQKGRQKAGSSGKGQGQGSGSGSGSGSGEGSEGEGGQDLAKFLEDLDQDAFDAESLAEQLDLQAQRGEKWDPDDYDRLMKTMDGKWSELSRCLSRMNSKQMAKRKFKGLAQRLNKAQDFANGRCESMARVPGNGLRAGAGSVESRRNEKEGLSNEGGLDRLKGQKGQGQTMNSIEEADSGSGAAHRQGQAVERNFQKQIDSFVERDDVPEEMKQGVKEYFETIHQYEQSQGSDE